MNQKKIFVYMRPEKVYLNLLVVEKKPSWTEKGIRA